MMVKAFAEAKFELSILLPFNTLATFPLLFQFMLTRISLLTILTIDSCIFLHDRGDYKQGWQLDREWENVTKGKKLAGTVVSSANRSKADEADEDDEALLESIPFACIICKEDYKNPIVTKCGHYFCESCALGRYRRDPSCAACGAGTNGVFNNAKKLKKLLERKRERELRADADVSDGEG